MTIVSKTGLINGKSVEGELESYIKAPDVDVKRHPGLAEDASEEPPKGNVLEKLHVCQNK